MARLGQTFFKVTSDNTKNFNAIIDAFKDQEVVVGIPESEAARKNTEDGGPINNAALLFINEFGSPVNNIPPRPAMALGLSKAADDIADQFHNAAVHAFEGGQDAIDKYYNRAGFVASSAIKTVINDQMGITPPSDATMASRKSQGIKSTKALIVTGQMRNAITHVVRERTWLK